MAQKKRRLCLFQRIYCLLSVPYCGGTRAAVGGFGARLLLLVRLSAEAKHFQANFHKSASRGSGRATASLRARPPQKCRLILMDELDPGSWPGGAAALNKSTSCWRSVGQAWKRAARRRHPGWVAAGIFSDAPPPSEGVIEKDRNWSFGVFSHPAQWAPLSSHPHICWSSTTDPPSLLLSLPPSPLSFSLSLSLCLSLSVYDDWVVVLSALGGGGGGLNLLCSSITVGPRRPSAERFLVRKQAQQIAEMKSEGDVSKIRPDRSHT